MDGNLAMQNNISEWEPGDYIQFTYGFPKPICNKLEDMYIKAQLIKPDLTIDAFIGVFIEDTNYNTPIKDCITLCTNRIAKNITDFPNLSYESGILEALNWIMGIRKEHPLTDITINDRT